MTDIIELTVERPVAGGRMLARHDGRVVFVAGAIPGERVRARVARVTKQSWMAETIEVIEASPDRRAPGCDPACGGSLWAHIQYARQRALKQQVIVDAFRRLARVELPEPPAVAASPEAGYRLRARLHGDGERVGFYREGTHTLCDAGPTAQLGADALAAAASVYAALGPRRRDCAAVTISENVAATQRVIHLEPHATGRLDEAADALRQTPDDRLPGVTGITAIVRGSLQTWRGADVVTDTAADVWGAAPPLDPAVEWTRRAPAFFQGNRFLLGALVGAVLDRATGDRVVDLYAGVGLFSVALAARGARVTSIEGEPFAAADLAANARPFGDRLRVRSASVEAAVRHPPDVRPDVIVLDPPRTGASAEAIDGLAAWLAPRLVYVSCDPPTLARDVARLAARGYRLSSIEAFDMFPNTPHVESVAVLTLSGSAEPR